MDPLYCADLALALKFGGGGSCSKETPFPKLQPGPWGNAASLPCGPALVATKKETSLTVPLTLLQCTTACSSWGAAHHAARVVTGTETPFLPPSPAKLHEGLRSETVADLGQ